MRSGRPQPGDDIGKDIYPVLHVRVLPFDGGTGTSDCQCYKHLVNSVLMYDENSEAAHAAMHGGFNLKIILKEGKASAEA